MTDFAGQKQDLRTMEPVAGEIGHCFVVGARHQLRASMSAGKNFSQRLSLRRQRQPRHFFLLGRIHLGAGSAGLLCRAGGAAGLLSPTIFWLLPAWSSELETGMSHFFGHARVEFRVEFPQSWGDRIEGGNPSIFFLGIPWRGLRALPGRHGR